MTDMRRPAAAAESLASAAAPPQRRMRQQVVLVLQGGGALGAYQAGVYQALMEGGIEPDWVIGTSIGAINGALIAGNPPAERIGRLRTFWDGIARHALPSDLLLSPGLGNTVPNLATILQGVPGFFAPNAYALWGPFAPLGVERASWYTTAPLADTLARLVDFDCIARRQVRLSVGAVNVRSGEMRYFDSRDMALGVPHVMASGALPPAFPAVRIDGEPYWDGGIYSNTPMELVLEDVPRHDSLIISVNLWQPEADEPQTIQQVMGRQKDIQYASRGRTHVAREARLHRLRHVVRELAHRLSPEQRADPAVQDLAEYGCGTLMHLVRLLAPRLQGEDHTKDIDFTRGGIDGRWQAGYAHAQKVLAGRPWEQPADPLQGIVIHESRD